ncbi:MAG: GFA family protein [Pseudomonadota bacterium]|nr:GFA family protein [Pseudomonadota bacterium]
MEGGCRCGAVRYTIAPDTRLRVYCCHCLACQSWTGSAFGQQAPVPEDAFAVTGPITTYTYQTPSGATSTHSVCGKCHSRVFNANARLPGWLLVRAGTFDTSDAIEPVAHIWISRKQPWIGIPAGIPIFEENASPEDFRAILFG